MPLPVSRPDSQRTPCRFVNSPTGCKRGESCQFLHGDAGKKSGSAEIKTALSYGGTPLNGGEASGSTPPTKSLRPCKWFAAGWCRRGDTCWFSHDTTLLADEPGPQARLGTVSPRATERRPSAGAGNDEPLAESNPAEAASRPTRDETAAPEADSVAADAPDTECPICTEPFAGLFGLMRESRSPAWRRCPEPSLI